MEYKPLKDLRVLDPHGESKITVTHAAKIFTKKVYRILEKMDLPCSNVALGVGCVFNAVHRREGGGIKPFTRDTFSSCIKLLTAD